MWGEDNSVILPKTGASLSNRLKLPNIPLKIVMQLVNSSGINFRIYNAKTSEDLYGNSTIRNAGVNKINIPALGETDVRIAFGTYGNANTITNIMIMPADADESYEPYTESEMYVTAYDENGDIIELRSLPNGTKDEVSNSKHIQRIGTKTNVVSGTVINYADMAKVGQYYAWNDNGETEAGIKGDTLGIDATKLTYQLSESIVTDNVQVSGTLLSYPSGTIYIENATADAGIYSDKMTVLHQDLPIDYIEKLSKVDFVTGLETELDVSQCVVAANKLSFTHPNLVDGDIVFFTYFYDREGTQGEFAGEYYDSRYVVKDSVTDKFYKWSITVSNGTPSISLMEV